MTSTAEDMITAGTMAAQSGAHSGHAGSALAHKGDSSTAVTSNGHGQGQVILHSQDEELERIMQLMSVEDQALCLALEKERASMESSMEKIHRSNNFRIDEAHIREANIAESRYMIESQDNERKALVSREIEEAVTLKEEEADKRMLELLMRDLRSLKMGVRQKQEAWEKVMMVKKRLSERRAANVLRMNAVEVRQERERKALQESHVRIIKNVTMFRSLLLQEVEDPSLSNLLTNGEISENVDSQVAVDRTEADKLHQTKMLQLKLRMQKEVEQLREEHLMKLKHITKLSEMELEQTEESETLVAEQKVQELELEAEQRKELESEEDQIAQQRASLKAFTTQRQLQTKAQRTMSHQRYEARQLTRQQKIASKARERQFFAAEEALMEALRGGGNLQDESGSAIDEDEEASEMGETRGHVRRSSTGSVAQSEVSEQSDMSEMTTDSMAETNVDEDGMDNTAAAESAEMDDQIRKERSRVEELTKRHIGAVDALRIQQRELREVLKREQQVQMSRLLGEQEDEYKQLKVQHHRETEALLKTQSAANALEEDNKGANDLLYGMLPRYVADAMKLGKEIPPKDFDCVTIFYSDIVQFTNLTAKSSPHQIVNLLNRLYTALDSALDDYTDLYKTETIGDAYQFVAGLNGDEDEQSLGHEAVIRRNAVDTVDCAVRFLDELKKMDMSDQIQPELFIRIGIHSGACVGGVAGVTMPKFAIFGESVTVASLMEQKSRPNKIHISQATYDLVKDGPFQIEKSDAPVAIEGGENMQTYWVIGRKKGASTSSLSAPRRASSARNSRGGSAGGKKKARVSIQ
ncbi:adenylate and guanylate cyclase catalytic domain-containing protein [Phlyctochytrium arcticum]|nr:adenylate and guanylate cyclase catalytic domain-containing protein [Phlyctochytrium arcticum]